MTTWEEVCKGQKSLQTPALFPASSLTLFPLVLQEQKCVPASGDLSPELQEWSPYSPGHSSRHGNPPLYHSRASVGESVGQGREEEGHCGPHRAAQPQGEQRQSIQGGAMYPQPRGPQSWQLLPFLG